MASALLAIAVSACIVQSSEDNRAEAFEFVPAPVGQQEAVEAFRSIFLESPAILDEESVTPIGKIETSAGSIIFADFQAIDPERGREQCSGTVSPTGNSWGCGPLGQEPPEDLPLPDVSLSMVGSSGRWSELQLRVSNDVSYLEAAAEDGTRYRMEPIANTVWMEWKTERGELSITGYDGNDQALGTVRTGG